MWSLARQREERLIDYLCNKIQEKIEIENSLEKEEKVLENDAKKDNISNTLSSSVFSFFKHPIRPTYSDIAGKSRIIPFFHDFFYSSSIIRSSSIDVFKSPDSPSFVVERIIGKSSTSTSELYVKFVDCAYLHCEWITIDEIRNREGGRKALDDFYKLSDYCSFVPSLSFTNLLVPNDSIIDSIWFEVDRIIDESQDDGEVEYLVKWLGLDYDQCTWEQKDLFLNSKALELYQNRMAKSNPKEIPTNWKRPSSDQYHDLIGILESKTGAFLKEKEIECINFIVGCYYNKLNVIHSDVNRDQQRIEIIVSINEIASRNNFKGPILVVCFETEIFQFRIDFESWTDFNVICFSDQSESQNMIIETEFAVLNQYGNVLENRIQADVIIVSYESFHRLFHIFSTIEWRIVVYDLGNLLEKNHSTLLDCLSSLVTEFIIWGSEGNLFSKDGIFSEIIHAINPSIPLSDDTGYNETISKFCWFNNSIHGPCNSIKVIYVNPSPIQIEYSNILMKEVIDTIIKPSQYNEQFLRTLFLHIEQISNHPLLERNTRPIHITSMQKTEKAEQLASLSGKLMYLEKILRSKKLLNKKVMVFSQMPSFLDIIEEFLNCIEISCKKCFHFDPNDIIQRILSEIMEGSKDVLLYSSKYGGFQIDTRLFDYIIIMDNDTNIPTLSQKTVTYRVYSLGFPEIDFEKNGVCFDENIQYIQPKYGLRTATFSELDQFARNFYLNLSKLNPSDFITFKIKNTNDVSTFSKSVVPMPNSTLTWNELNDSIESFSSKEDIIEFIKDKGIQNRKEAINVVKAALIENHLLTIPEKELIKCIIEKNLSKNDDNKPYGLELQRIQSLSQTIVKDALFFLHIQHSLFILSHNQVIWSTNYGRHVLTPLQDYTLMYELHRNGFSYTLGLISKGNLHGIEMKDKYEIQHRILNICQEIETNHQPSISLLDFVPIPPQKWAAMYVNAKAENAKNSQSSKSLTEVIYHTLLHRGIPHDRDMVINWPLFIDFVSYKGATPKSITEITGMLLNACKTSLRKRCEVSLPNQCSLPSVHNRISIVNAKKVIDTILLMGEVYTMCTDFQMNKTGYFKKLNKSAELPAWWTPNHYRMFINAVYKYGIRKFFSWIVDPSFPFYHHIPQNKIPMFKKYAETESFGADLKRIGDIEDFVWLSKRSNRIKKIQWISEEIHKIGEFRRLKILDKEHPYIFEPYDRLKIRALGKIVKDKAYNSNHGPYPVGYISERQFKYIDSAPQWFRCEIKVGDGIPIFIVTSINNQQKEYIGLTPKEAWNAAITDMYRVESHRVNISGLWLFGLIHPSVVKLLKEIGSSQQWNDIEVCESGKRRIDDDFKTPFSDEE